MPKSDASSDVKVIKDGLDPSVHPAEKKISDTDLARYTKMLKMGVPRAAVNQKMRNDGFDPRFLSEGVQNSPSNHHEELIPYMKMLKMGVPREAVMHKMKKDGLDPSDLPDNSGMGNGKEATKDAAAEVTPELVGPALKNDKRFTKYFTMLKMGIPKAAVQHKMAQDGVDPAVMNMDPNKPWDPSKASRNGPTRSQKRTRKRRLLSAIRRRSLESSSAHA